MLSMWKIKKFIRVDLMEKEKSIVRQSNDLIDASYKIETAGESRLIRLLIAQIKPDDEDFKAYKIRTSDFANMFGLSDQDGRLHELIDKASESLTSRKITIRNGKSWIHMNWLSSAKYQNGSGYVELRFDVNLKPYLLQLKGYFTQYKIEKISHFKSMYSIRFFELLKMEEFKADAQGRFKKSFEYEELRNKIGLDQKEYRSFADFRRFILVIVEREISENSDILITQIDYPKTGRKITHIVFHCEKKPPSSNDKCNEKKPETLPDDVRELVAMGIDEYVAWQWRKKYGVKRLIRNITYTKTMHKAGKIRESLTGFLATAITKNMGGAEDFQREELEKKRKAVQEAEHARKQEWEHVNALENKKTKTYYDGLMMEFQKIPQDTKNTVRDAFEKQLDPVLLSMWKRAKERNPDAPESHLPIKPLFLRFFQDVQHPGHKEDTL